MYKGSKMILKMADLMLVQYIYYSLFKPGFYKAYHSASLTAIILIIKASGRIIDDCMGYHSFVSFENNTLVISHLFDLWHTYRIAFLATKREMGCIVQPAMIAHRLILFFHYSESLFLLCQ